MKTEKQRADLDGNLTRETPGRVLVGSTYFFHDVTDLGILTEDNYRPTDLDYVDSLKESIKEAGVTVPVNVTLEKSGSGAVFKVIDGHQRLAAVRSLREEALREDEEWLYRKLPVRLEVIAEGSGARKGAVASVIPNQLYKKENPVERALGVSRLKTEGGYSNERLAKILGITRKTVERSLALLGLPKPVLEAGAMDPTVTEARLSEAARVFKKALGEGIPAGEAEQVALSVLKRIKRPETGAKSPCIPAVQAGISTANNGTAKVARKAGATSLRKKAKPAVSEAIINTLEKEGLPKMWITRMRELSQG